MDRPLILVVDDHEDSARLTVRILGAHGFDVEMAGSGEEALTMAHQRSFDLFLLDVRLPDCDGVHLCCQLKHKWPKAPVIFCSAQAGEASIKGCLSRCGEAYFCKPLDWASLVGAIHRHVAPSLTESQEKAA